MTTLLNMIMMCSTDICYNSNFFSIAGFFYFLCAMICFDYSIYIWKKKEQQQEDAQLEPEPESERKTIKYEDKYLEKYTFKKEEEEEGTQPKRKTEDELNLLKNTIVMETTPMGNVMMYWDNKRETFVYYADSSIPYRILEVVSRKYVTMYDCRYIYVNMEDEIKLAEEKLDEKKRKLEEIQQRKQEEKVEDKKAPEEQKSVFAKLKNYNKTSIQSSAVVLDPKKSSYVPSTNVNTKPEKEFILKENANRYSYEGKMANFHFLQKVDKKVVDKRLNMTFSEYKSLASSELKSPEIKV
jgi:hypothetical protein